MDTARMVQLTNPALFISNGMSLFQVTSASSSALLFIILAVQIVYAPQPIKCVEAVFVALYLTVSFPLLIFYHGDNISGFEF